MTRGTRDLMRQWRNGRGAMWTRRARWYEGETTGIRLTFYDIDHEWSDYPQSMEEAERLWALFKSGQYTRPKEARS